MVKGGSASVVENEPSIDYEIVKKGSKGDWVKKLQQALGVDVDGIFGQDAEQALKHGRKKWLAA